MMSTTLPRTQLPNKMWLSLRRRSLTTSTQTNQQKEDNTSSRLRSRRRSADIATLQDHLQHPSCLKKQPSGLSAFLSQVVDNKHLKNARLAWTHPEETDDDENQTVNQQEEILEHVQRKACRVHFPKILEQTLEWIESTTEEEKALYHYSRQELGIMIAEGKDALLRESRFEHQTEETIYEQGYLTFPKEAHFFSQKRYYCLLKARQLVCYTSSAHAAKNSHIKHSFAIVKVQDCSTMSTQTKLRVFGAHVPINLSRMFLVSYGHGEQILLSAENRHAKRNWVHALQRLTEIREVLKPPLKLLPLPLFMRQVSVTSTSSSSSDEDETSVHIDNGQEPEQGNEPAKAIAVECIEFMIEQLEMGGNNNREVENNLQM